MELELYLVRTLCPIGAFVYNVWTIVVYIVWTTVNNVNLHPNWASHRDYTLTRSNNTNDTKRCV